LLSTFTYINIYLPGYADWLEPNIFHDSCGSFSRTQKQVNSTLFDGEKRDKYFDRRQKEALDHLSNNGDNLSGSANKQEHQNPLNSHLRTTPLTGIAIQGLHI
jgi:hypothetical protein